MILLFESIFNLIM